MRASLAVLASLAFVACTTSDPDPASPTPTSDAGSDAGTSSGAVVPPAPSPVDAGTDAPAPLDSGVDAGPTVTGIEVSVPPLASALPIAIAPSTKPVDASVVSKAYELTPNGTTFENDLDLCIETTKRVNAQDVCLGYYDEASSKWKCEDTCLKRKADTNTLCGKTNHFTSFAILIQTSDSKETAASEGACHSALLPPSGGAIAAPDGQASASFVGGTLPKATRVTITKLALTGAELASPAYELTPNGSYARDVEVCIRPSATVTAASPCLGYLDKTGSAPAWKCEDRCLTRRGDQLCGSTSHFTSFAVLLGGGSSSASCADETFLPAGGTLGSLDGVASFTAEQGTFTQPTRVTIARAPSEIRLASDVFELLPSGNLAAKGKVCIKPSPGADLTSACLGFKDATGAWKCDAPTCLTQKPDGQLCGETTHFTSFAILLGGGTGTTCTK